VRHTVLEADMESALGRQRSLVVAVAGSLDRTRLVVVGIVPAITDECLHG